MSEDGWMPKTLRYWHCPSPVVGLLGLAIAVGCVVGVVWTWTTGEALVATIGTVAFGGTAVAIIASLLQPVDDKMAERFRRHFEDDEEAAS